MKDLIEALTIFAKYADNSEWPLNCSHDLLTICAGVPAELEPADVERVKELGFFWGEDAWQSHRFGSC